MCVRQILLALTVTLVFGLSPAAAEGNADTGKKLSGEHCTRCHVVGDINPGGGISSTPSFQMLVQRRPDYEERFQTFFARRPHAAFMSIKGVGRIRPDLPPNSEPIELTEEEVADIVSYTHTLRPQTDEEKRKARMPLVLSPRPKPRTN